MLHVNSQMFLEMLLYRLFKLFNVPLFVFFNHFPDFCVPVLIVRADCIRGCSTYFVFNYLTLDRYFKYTKNYLSTGHFAIIIILIVLQYIHTFTLNYASTYVRMGVSSS